MTDQTPDTDTAALEEALTGLKARTKAQHERLDAERDELVVQALLAGMTPYRISQLTGLSQPGVALIRERHLRLIHYVARDREGLYADDCLCGPRLLELIGSTTDAANPELIEVASDPGGIPERPYWPTAIKIAIGPKVNRQIMVRMARGEWQRITPRAEPED